MQFLVFAIGAGIVVVTYTSLSFGNGTMLLLGFPLGFASGVFSAMGAFYTENFPTRVRGVGQGFTYNVGRSDGRPISDVGWITVGDHSSGPSHRRLCGNCIRNDGDRGFLVARDQRQSFGRVNSSKSRASS
jgi:hypothetical protein